MGLRRIGEPRLASWIELNDCAIMVERHAIAVGDKRNNQSLPLRSQRPGARCLSIHKSRLYFDIAHEKFTSSNRSGRNTANGGAVLVVGIHFHLNRILWRIPLG